MSRFVRISDIIDTIWIVDAVKVVTVEEECGFRACGGEVV
jgi:hypothetical protein